MKWQVGDFEAAGPAAGPGFAVLKRGDTFAVLAPSGDVKECKGLGLYHDGTRYLSRMELRGHGFKPVVLSSALTPDGTEQVVDLTCPEVERDGRRVLPRQGLHVRRRTRISEGRLHLRLELALHAREPATFALGLALEADFADVFEVRGWTRARRGELERPRISERRLELSYRGLDRVTRRAVLTLDVAAEIVHAMGSPALVALPLTMEPGSTRTIEVDIQLGPAVSIEQVAAHAHAPEYQRPQLPRCPAETTDAGLGAWIDRSWKDLNLLLTRTPHGLYPHAGVPWYATPFGRDGLITAFSLLPFHPELAGGVLSYLAATQATGTLPERDAQPGKILHEARSGEMAALGEVPYGRYYGSADATPLFVMLAAAHFRRTGDRLLAEKIWPAVERALAWMDGPGDPDGDGFLEYDRRADGGLVHQGWKDTADAVFHADGTLLEGPVALCEVQAYAHAARAGAAELARALGVEVAPGPAAAAAERAARFDAAFWDDRLGTYILALDGKKQPCRLRTSNAAHVLWAGLATPERAQRLAATLMAPDAFSGWGVRTLAAGSPRYHPFAYHNGSIWPHDTALAAAGLARYGHTREALTLAEALLDASRRMPLARLPELFAGLPREPDLPPTPLPVACSPQAWAAASAFMVLGALLGLEVDAVTRSVRLVRPALPAGVKEIVLRGLAVGEGVVDLAVHQEAGAVRVRVLFAEGVTVAVEE